MSIKNKVLVNFYLEDGCSQEDGETSYSWKPINFYIYSELFPELIQIGIDDWLSENKVEHGFCYEVIMIHCIEHDGSGAVTSEYFEPIYSEKSIL